MKASYRNRVTALEKKWSTTMATANGDGNLFHLNSTPSTPKPTTYQPTRTADGRFSGTIQDNDAVRVRVTRPVTFARDNDGTWTVFSHDAADSLATNEIRVQSPPACLTLDLLFELFADPDNVGTLTVRDPDGD